MQRIAIFAAFLLMLSAPLLVAKTEIVIHRADVRAVEVSGTSVMISVGRPSAMYAPDPWRDLSIRLAFTVALTKDVYISNTALKVDVLTVTFTFPDSASAAQFATSVTGEDHG